VQIPTMLFSLSSCFALKHPQSVFFP
jgi:hypothetical protein